MTPVKAVNHVGIAVRSIDAQRPFYEGTLGAVFEGIELVPDQKVRVGFFRVGDVRFELLEPTEATSTIAGFLEKRGEGLHHIALTVENLCKWTKEYLDSKGPQHRLIFLVDEVGQFIGSDEKLCDQLCCDAAIQHHRIRLVRFGVGSHFRQAEPNVGVYTFRDRSTG